MFDGDHGTYHVDCSGDPDAPYLIMLSGLASDSRSWAPVVQNFEQKFRLLMPDNLGCGRTINKTPQNISLTNMVDDYAKLIEKQADKPVHVMGHSMGAMMALDLAARYPDLVDKLVLAAGAVCVSAPMAQLLRDMAVLRDQLEKNDEPQEIWFRLLFQWLFAPTFFDDDRAVAIAAQLSVAMPNGQSADDFKAQVAAILAVDFDHHPEVINAPTLGINGSLDRFFAGFAGANRLQAISNITMIEMANAGHSLHWDEPTIFARYVIEFLQS